MGICLNMIVKDESKNLSRLFESIAPYIDYFIISDTGSRDQTIERIYQLGSSYNIPGKVVTHPWENFSTNRQLALEAALESKVQKEHDCQWLMIIDADEELTVFNPDWVKNLEEGFTYTIYKKLGGLSFKHFFLLWIDGEKWHWQGIVHNYLVNENKMYQKKHLNDIHIHCYPVEKSAFHFLKDPDEKARHYIYQLQLELKSTPLAADNVHRHFQLASTYMNNKDAESAIQVFKKIVDFDQTPDGMRYISLIFLSKSMLVLHKDEGDIRPFLLQAESLNGNRKEAGYYLAILERAQGNLNNAKNRLEQLYSLDTGQVEYNVWEEDIYAWRLKYELAFVCYLLKDFKMSIQIVSEIISEKQIPEIERSFLLSLEKKMKTAEEGQPDL